MQLFSAHLNGLALGLQRLEHRHIEESLRAFAGLQARYGGVSVMLILVDIDKLMTSAEMGLIAETTH